MQQVDKVELLLKIEHDFSEAGNVSILLKMRFVTR